MPSPSQPLVAGIRRGDEAAFARFYELWFDRSVAAVRSLTRRDEAFCLDVVQDCMLKVVRKLPRLEDEAAVDSWMARTLCSTAVDRLRSEQRRRRRERIAADDRPEAVHAQPHDALSHREQLGWIRERIAELPAPERQLLLHRFDDGGTLRAAGEKAGLSPFAVHGRIRRTLARWRALAASR